MALRGCDSVPRRRALISGEVINKRYSESWKSDKWQKTTCSYLTGTRLNVNNNYAHAMNNMTHGISRAGRWSDG